MGCPMRLIPLAATGFALLAGTILPSMLATQDSSISEELKTYLGLGMIATPLAIAFSVPSKIVLIANILFSFLNETIGKKLCGKEYCIKKASMISLLSSLAALACLTAMAITKSIVGTNLAEPILSFIVGAAAAGLAMSSTHNIFITPLENSRT